jgi:hypothetical protein
MEWGEEEGDGSIVLAVVIFFSLPVITALLGHFVVSL